MNLRRVTYWIVGLCLVSFCGCRGQEPIEEYTVPKQSVVDQLTGAKSPPPRVRPSMMRSTSMTTFLIAAIVPRKTTVWFFKMALDGDALTPGVFRQSVLQTIPFFESLQFSESEDEPPTWTIPPDWQQRAGPSPRYATIITGAAPGLPEITVTRLPMPEGDVDACIQDNIVRWQGQMQGGPDRVKVQTRQIPVGGATATLVTMLLADADEHQAAAAPALAYDTPEGWKPGRMNRFRRAAFVVEEGREKVETTVIPLVPSPLLDNINRWRGEVGLENIQAKQVSEHARQFTVDSIEGHYVQCVGATRTVLVVLFEHADQMWFITLRGDNALARREQKHFEQFAGSIKFKQPDGEGDGK